MEHVKSLTKWKPYHATKCPLHNELVTRRKLKADGLTNGYSHRTSRDGSLPEKKAQCGTREFMAPIFSTKRKISEETRYKSDRKRKPRRGISREKRSQNSPISRGKRDLWVNVRDWTRFHVTDEDGVRQDGVMDMGEWAVVPFANVKARGKMDQNKWIMVPFMDVKV